MYLEDIEIIIIKVYLYYNILNEKHFEADIGTLINSDYVIILLINVLICYFWRDIIESIDIKLFDRIEEKYTFMVMHFEFLVLNRINTVLVTGKVGDSLEQLKLVKLLGSHHFHTELYKITVVSAKLLLNPQKKAREILETNSINYFHFLSKWKYSIDCGKDTSDIRIMKNHIKKEE